MAKLVIPSPEEKSVDRSDVQLSLLAAVLVFALCGIGIAKLHGQREAARNVADPTTTETGEPLDPLQVQLKLQRKRSEELAKLTAADFDAMQWSDEDREVVFRYGPRDGSEAVCRKLASQIEAGTLESRWRLEIEKTLDRRTEFAPWTCMTRLFLDEKLPEGELKKEMEEAWAEIEQHGGNARIPISFLTAFRETRDRPESPKFYAWLRMCAFDLDYEAFPECQRLINQIRPAQGDDMLLMLEKHWKETGQRPSEMPWITRTLGLMARNGQPPNFQVKETEQLPDYDVDFRQATVGYLCRLANTPTPRERKGITSEYDEVPVLASEELRKVAEFGARSYEDKLLRRWRETCLLSMGGNGGYQDEERVGVPILAVWNGDTAAAPEYSLLSVTNRGDCDGKAGYPHWYCLSEKWGGEGKPLQRALAEFFIETRYMEWTEFEEDEKPVKKTAKPDAGNP